MDLSLNEVQEMLADSIDKFIDNEYDFDTRQTYAASESGYSEAVWAKFAELGWTAVPFSEEDGGFDGGPIDIMVVMQRFGRGLVVEPYLANVVLAGGILKRTGNAEQKTRWLQPLIAGELQATLAFTEPQSRYDLANIETTATADGDDWVLSGNKGFVLNGATADLIIVPARTSGDSTDQDGITLFAVDTSLAGVACRGYHTVDGARAAEVSLDKVRVASDALLGDRRRRLRRAASDGRRCHPGRVRGGSRHHAVAQGQDDRIFEEPYAIWRADRQLPGVAAPHGRHAHGLRTGAVLVALGRHDLRTRRR